MARDVFDTCDRHTPPSDLEIAAQMLRLALRMGVPSYRIIEFLTDTTAVRVASRFFFQEQQKTMAEEVLCLSVVS